MRCYHRPLLPLQLQLLIQYRFASTTSHPFPFPCHPRPTPHQIFHLPYGASHEDIKARYYELVRIYHPDSTHSRSLSPAERRARFQSIAAAYDVLRGRKAHTGDDPYAEEIQRRKRAYYRHYSQRQRPEYAYYGHHNWHASADDRWKDRVILFVGITTLAAGVLPGLIMFPAQLDRRHLAAASNLAQAREEARELGEERRRELRRRVKEIKETANRTDDALERETTTS